MKGLSILQRIIAYLFFISIVVRFIACQLTKGFTTERQQKEFRYFSFAGLIGLLIAVVVSSIDAVGSFALLYIWFGVFVVAEIVERKFSFSNYFEE